MKLLLALAFCTSTALAQTAPTGHVPTQDVDLAYWVLGSSHATTHATTPVIAINGGPGLSHIYMMQNDVWPRIANTRQVVLYDQRGTGASPLTKSGAPQTPAAQVADLDAIREHLHFDKIDLIGDSYGGVLAMAYTAAHPEHVRKLILSDSAPPSLKDFVHLLPQVFPDTLEAQAKSANPSATAEAKAQQGMRDHFQMIFYSPEKRDAYLANATDLGFTPATSAAVWAASAGFDLNPAIVKFTCPTLVITGRYDMNVAPLTAWHIYKTIPGATFLVFEKSGHLPSYEEPDKYVQTVNDFLDSK